MLVGNGWAWVLPRKGADSAGVATARPLQEILTHQLRVHEWEQVPTRKHIGLNAEAVASDTALQPGGEKRSSAPARTRIGVAGHAVKSHTESNAMSASGR
jgi:hypothetical protein